MRSYDSDPLHVRHGKGGISLECVTCNSIIKCRCPRCELASPNHIFLLMHYDTRDAPRVCIRANPIPLALAHAQNTTYPTLTADQHSRLVPPVMHLYYPKGGSSEYKRRVHSNLSSARLRTLSTQMSYRLDEGGGRCTYHVGVEDDRCHSLLAIIPPSASRLGYRRALPGA